MYLGNPNGTLYVSPNPYELTKTDIVWTPIKTFAYQPIPLAVGGSPLDGALYITLNNYARSTLGRTLRSDDGGATWIALTIPAPSGAATPTPSHLDTLSNAACDAHADAYTHFDAHGDTHSDADGHTCAARATRGLSTAGSRRTPAG